ncbi:branched-chain amino acid ABC transporter permease [Pararhizobium qamdonense]|uniref:branched-chain amino acid ABC transporter permease n=1 Tax=Pararhizobium qamdonense TaxID=3031126 RepID=UPI0023E297FE|nr:branched-chain amino acid ABC transporter permease [Pararhizobium qamdonense]
MDTDALFMCLSSSACAATQISTAFIIGMLLFLVASGLSLIFGVLNVTNFAHGGLYMLGAYFALSTFEVTGNFWAALVVAALATGVVGIILERLVISRIYGADLLMQLLVCYALTLIMDDAVRFIYGSEYKMMGMPQVFDLPPVAIAGGFVPSYYLFMIGASAVAGLALWFVINRTRFGKVVRALAINPKMVSALGINTTLLYAAVFGVGSGLAGLAGGLAAPIRTLTPGMGLSFLLDSFIIIVIGGMGSIGGAFVASILVGFIKAFGAIGFPLFTDGLMFVIMAIVLILKPQGLFGERSAL